MRPTAFWAAVALGAATPTGGVSAQSAPQTPPERDGSTETGGQGEAAAALAWRFLDGEGVVGVLRLSAGARVADGPIGFFVLRIAERGVFEGIYNLKEDGQSLIGVFWAEGDLNGDLAAGFLDVSLREDGSGGGALTFTSGGSIDVIAR